MRATVDLWDLTKLLFRRWYVTLPMLVISLTGVLLVSQTVKPDYSAVGHLQLLPAPGVTTPDPKASDPKAAVAHNPWGDLGFQALGLAVIVKMQDPKIAESLKAAGLSQSYGVTIEYGTTFFSVTATGTSPKQATGTVQQVMKLIAAEVASQQQRFNVGPESTITTLELDKGDSVTEITSKFTRVVMVSAGIGFLATTGLTIAVDAWLRRRERRNSGAARREAGLDMVPTSGGGHRLTTSDTNHGVAIASSPTLSKKSTDSGGRYAMADTRGATATPAAELTVEYRGRSGEAEMSGAEQAPPTEAMESAPDSTIVLPLQLSRSHNGGPENRRP
jgi:hypothetical protein